MHWLSFPFWFNIHDDTEITGKKGEQSILRVFLEVRESCKYWNLMNLFGFFSPFLLTLITFSILHFGKTATLNKSFYSKLLVRIHHQPFFCITVYKELFFFLMIVIKSSDIWLCILYIMIIKKHVCVPL